MDMEKDPLFRGEFDVVKQLISERPEMVAAKKRVRDLESSCFSNTRRREQLCDHQPHISQSNAEYLQADKLVDLCGPPKTGGTGIKQLR